MITLLLLVLIISPGNFLYITFSMKNKNNNNMEIYINAVYIIKNFSVEINKKFNLT